MLQEAEFRDRLCESPVQCFAVTSDYVLWSDHGTHRLYIWTRNSGQDVQVLTKLEPWFEPHLMVASEDGCLLCCDGAGHVNFYTIDVLRAAPETYPQEKGLGPLGDGREVVGESSSLPHRTVVRSQETCDILQRWSLRLHASDVPSHADISPDGMLTALSTPSHLFLVLRSPEGDHADSLSCLATNAFISIGGEVHTYACLSSHALLNGENRRELGEGCTRSCFLSSDRLCVLFADNQLIAVRIHLDNDSHLSTSFLRDGHVISPRHTVVAMAASVAQECLLVIGLSNGSVHVLHAERLEVFKVLDLPTMLTAYFGKSSSLVGLSSRSDPSLPRPAPGVGVGPAVTILSLTLGHSLVIATPRHVLRVDKRSFFLLPDDVAVVAGPEEEAGRSAAVRGARDGSWAAALDGGRVLRYAARRGPPPPSSLAEAAALDVVHAAGPLPWAPAPPPPRPPPAPLVARTRPVQSSQYTTAPWSVQHARERRRKENEKAAARAVGSDAGTAPLGYRPRLPYAAHPFAAVEAANRVLATQARVHQTAVRANAFSAGGGALVTGSGDRAAYYLKLPLRQYRGDGHLLRAHTAAVLSVSLNMALKTPLVATGGAEGVIHVWKPTAGEAPLLTYTAPKGGEGASSGAAEIRAVRFYYMDKFLCYTSQNQLMVSQHTLGKDQPAVSSGLAPALKKGYPRNSRSCNVDSSALGIPPPRIFDPVFTYAITEAQAVTAMDCINHFVSTLVVLASSNKQIRVLDLAAEAPLRVMSDAHSRQIHHLAMCTGSRFAGSACSLSAQHLFASSGLDGAVYVWDLRQSQPVRQLALHKNQALPTLGLAFSPDGSMLAVGSENDAVYVYDVGMGGGGVPMDKLCCSNVPTAIAWHPTEPLMAVGLATGETVFFKQR